MYDGIHETVGLTVFCLSFWKGVVRGELHFLHAHPIKNIEEEIQGDRSQRRPSSDPFFVGGPIHLEIMISMLKKSMMLRKIKMIIIMMHNSKQEKKISI